MEHLLLLYRPRIFLKVAGNVGHSRYIGPLTEVYLSRWYPFRQGAYTFLCVRWINLVHTDVLNQTMHLSTLKIAVHFWCPLEKSIYGIWSRSNVLLNLLSIDSAQEFAERLANVSRQSNLVSAFFHSGNDAWLKVDGKEEFVTEGPYKFHPTPGFSSYGTGAWKSWLQFHLFHHHRETTRVKLGTISV